MASGAYKPTAANKPLNVRAGVALYGGFSGIEMTLQQRDPSVHVTVLSGDINGDDTSGVFDQKRGDNAIHVLEVTPSSDPDACAIVDGFTISGG